MTNHISSRHADPTMIEATRQYIESKLLSTERPGIEKVIDLMRNSDFYTARCGRHHRFVGGMSQHAVETYLYASAHNDAHVSESSLIITCLLHDLCDISGYKGYTGHGRRSMLLVTTECNFELTLSESDAILHHMHSKSKPYKFGNDYERVTSDPLWIIVHHADRHSAGHLLNRYQLYLQMTGEEYPIHKTQTTGSH